MARDCPVNRDPTAAVQNQNPSTGKGGFDSEYANLMAELGESGKGPGDGAKPWAGGAGHDITAGGTNIPPWRRPEMWQSNIPQSQSQSQSQSQQFRPPGPDAGYAGMQGGYGGANQWGQPQQGNYQGYQQPGYDNNYAAYYQGQYTQQQVPTPTH